MEDEGDDGLLETGNNVKKRPFVPAWTPDSQWDLNGYGLQEQVALITKVVQDYNATPTGKPTMGTFRNDNAASTAKGVLNTSRNSYLEFRCTTVCPRRSGLDLTKCCPIHVKFTRTNSSSTTVWTLTSIHHEHSEECPVPTRKRGLNSGVFMPSLQQSGVSNPSSQQVTDLLSAGGGSNVRPTMHNSYKLSTKIKFGDKLKWIEDTMLLPGLVKTMRANDPRGTFVVQTRDCPLKIRNVPENAARCLEWMFFAPGVSRDICNAFPNIVGSMDAAFIRHWTGGVQFVLSIANGMGTNTVLCVAYFHNESMLHWDIFRQLLEASGIWLTACIADWHAGIVNAFNEWIAGNLEHREQLQRIELPMVNSEEGVDAVGPLPNFGRLTRKSAAAAAAAAAASTAVVVASDNVVPKVRGVDTCLHCECVPSNWTRGDCNCLMWFCSDKLECMEALVAHRSECKSYPGMFFTRDRQVDPHSPYPTGMRCVLHLCRDLGVEKSAKDIMTMAAKSTSHRAFEHHMVELERVAGPEIRNKFEKMKYKTTFLFAMDYFARHETLYQLTNNNTVETMNHSHEGSRSLGPMASVLCILGKIEDRNSKVYERAVAEHKKFKVTFHARVRVANNARNVDEHWKVAQVLRCTDEPFPVVSVKLVKKGNPMYTKVVRLSLDPDLQLWYERASVEGDFGTRALGIPCKFCSYVLFFLPTIIPMHYQQSKVRMEHRIADLDHFTTNPKKMSVDNPDFYEPMYHLERIVSGYHNSTPLLANFNPETATRYLLVNRQGQVNKQKRRFEKGVMSADGRKRSALQTKALNAQREVAADVATCRDADNLLRSGDGYATANAEVNQEVDALLKQRSSHAHELHHSAARKFIDYMRFITKVV